MLEKTIILKSFDDVRNFVNLANTVEYDIELVSGKYTVDAKSIMGVFSLDLTKPMTMVAHCELAASLAKKIEPFLVEEK